MSKWRCTVCGADHPYLPDRCKNCGNPVFEKFATKKEYRRKQKLRRGLRKSKRYTLKAGKYLAIGVFIVIALLAIGLVVMEPSLLISDNQSGSSGGNSEPFASPTGDEPPVFEKVGERRYEPENWEYTGKSEELEFQEIERQEIERLVIEYTNEERVADGVSEVDHKPSLSRQARAHSQDMAINGYLGHVDSSGREPWERVPDNICYYVAENAALDYYGHRAYNERREKTITNRNEQEIAQSLVDSWMTSPPHRKNLLDPGNTELGVGVHVTEDGVVFATQKFCADETTRRYR